LRPVEGHTKEAVRGPILGGRDCVEKPLKKMYFSLHHDVEQLHKSSTKNLCIRLFSHGYTSGSKRIKTRQCLANQNESISNHSGVVAAPPLLSKRKDAVLGPMRGNPR